MITADLVRQALVPVVDPEIAISIVDLGLVYGIDVMEDGKKVAVRMTLTSPMCPMGPEIIAAAKGAVRAIKGVEEVDIQLVWEPAWDPTTMASDDAKDLLGIW